MSCKFIWNIDFEKGYGIVYFLEPEEFETVENSFNQIFGTRVTSRNHSTVLFEEDDTCITLGSIYFYGKSKDGTISILSKSYKTPIMLVSLNSPEYSTFKEKEILDGISEKNGLATITILIPETEKEDFCKSIEYSRSYFTKHTEIQKEYFGKGFKFEMGDTVFIFFSLAIFSLNIENDIYEFKSEFGNMRVSWDNEKLQKYGIPYLAF